MAGPGSILSDGEVMSAMCTLHPVVYRIQYSIVYSIQYCLVCAMCTV